MTKLILHYRKVINNIFRELFFSRSACDSNGHIITWCPSVKTSSRFNVIIKLSVSLSAKYCQRNPTKFRSFWDRNRFPASSSNFETRSSLSSLL